VKKSIYESLLPQISGLVSDESNLMANLANVASVLHHSFSFFWTGFYFKDGDQLVLGPFQGPVACTRINFGKGVCGTAWKNHHTIIVDDVDKFPGHISCNEASRSEIVVPVFKNDELIFLLDIDSDKYSLFDEIDEFYLQKIVLMLSESS
jgi:L-methionine (R)-S-oxide reductase